MELQVLKEKRYVLYSKRNFEITIFAEYQDKLYYNQ